MISYKPYKACNPTDTVSKIRSILQTQGVFLKEKSFSQSGLYACRVCIENDDLSILNIGTNGKGRSYEFALASGYAEFMERLQNNLLLPSHNLHYATQKYLSELPDDSKYKQFIIDNNLLIDSINSDDQFHSIDDVWGKYSNDIKSLFDSVGSDESYIHYIKELTDASAIRCCPVYSFIDKTTVFFPTDLAILGTGSNGMCAGNNPLEALLQGMCEIFERYAAKEIFTHNITPPTIPIDYFKGTSIYNKIKELEKNQGLHFIIKDCSLGKGLPVIGVIMINHNSGTYNFKLGSDFVPHIALERCITETYQSKLGAIMLPIHYSHIFDVSHEYYKMLASGTGQWPETIFMDSPSYPFCGFNSRLGKDNKYDFDFACDLIINLGSNLYIQDNSFLGFPTYYIIAPKLSGVYLDSKELLLDKEHSPESLGRKVFQNLFDNTTSFLEALACSVQYWLDKHAKFDFNAIMPFCYSKELIDLDSNLFLCMFFYKKKEYEKSLDFLRVFIQEQDYRYAYYFAAADYIKHYRIQHCTLDDTKSVLSFKYGATIANEVIDDLSSPENVFQYYSFQEWYCLDKWIDHSSLFTNALLVLKQINSYKRDNPINQNCLSLLFNSSNA